MASEASAILPLKDRVAIVTGASRGIGKAIALHLASLGAKLLINYVSNTSQADLVASQINSSFPGAAVTLQGDVSDPATVAALFDKAEHAFNSPVHILVNSAGITDPYRRTLADLPLEDFDRIFSVNVRGSFLCAQEGAKRVKRGGGGRIILISSSLVGFMKAGTGVYTASKSAVETMTKIVAKEVKGSGITVNCVAPGAIATEMFLTGKSEEEVKKVGEDCPMGRLGEAMDVAPLVGFLASDSGGWVNGQVIRVNGGMI
ncbi:NADPH-dependent aldehyde reductase-like protein, chloroplastic [Cucumis sativus]|uniref:Uncharacterized protein n=1 Tax=Cucumis sativus TaxID=3659 RepID=A0A0A0LG97_CUCSA|nr:NADPH-dependent aldehyde reductase-like protein, chloroplastic [Cucumis sativus]KGN59762.1 hypothetical protein Csa_000736 [Cucumis sativus]